MNRREVVQKFLMGGTVLVVVPSVLVSCSKDDTDPTQQGPPPSSTLEVDLSLPANSALNTTGGSRILSNVIIINMGSGFVALSSICTHEGCTVGYNSTSGNLECPCHGSVYSISGNVLVGPAPRALTKYTVTQTGTILTITQ
jgi:cytochrome b6-f complex iron-sulfur subunit